MFGNSPGASKPGGFGSARCQAATLGQWSGAFPSKGETGSLSGSGGKGCASARETADFHENPGLRLGHG